MSGGHEPNPVTLRMGLGGEAVQGNFWEQVGGRPTFEKLVRAFYDGIATDEVLLPMYPEQPDLEGANSVKGARPPKTKPITVPPSDALKASTRRAKERG